jgi:CIC family chloride channel protein
MEPYDKLRGVSDGKEWDIFRVVQSFCGKAKIDEQVMMIILAVLIGAITGGAAIIFGFLIGWFHDIFLNKGYGLGKELAWWGRYSLPLIPAAGGLIVGLLIRYGAREAKGPGVSEVMNAVATRGGIIRPRVAAIKSLASAITIGSGGSAGREGPIVQIGSALGSGIGQLFNLSSNRINVLVCCGAAAGIAATFNAPIAGALFATEVILGAFSVEAFGPIIIASVIGSSVSRMYYGDFPMITVTEYVLQSPLELPLYAVLGVLLGFGALLFTKSLYFFEDRFNSLNRFIPEWLTPAIGGLLIGIMGLWLPQVMGIGYEWMEIAFEAKFVWWMLLLLFFGKILATSLTLGSGGSGGVFAPSLFMGAVFGGMFGMLVNWLFPAITAPPGAYALVGMGAMVGGTSYAALTGIITVFEMTDDYRIVLPLMLTVVISTIVAKRFEVNSIYTLKLARRGINIRQGRDVDVLENITVREIMRHHFEMVSRGMLFGELLKFIEVSRQNCFPVVDEEEHLTGVVSLQNIRRWINEPDLAKLVVVDELSTKNVITLTERESLLSALVKFERLDVESLPVVDDENERQLVGLLFRDDLNKTYRSRTLGKISREDGDS